MNVKPGIDAIVAWFEEVGDCDASLRSRVGHAMVVALTGFEVPRGTWRQDDPREGLRTIAPDPELCRMGVPWIPRVEQAWGASGGTQHGMR